jgi:membrane protein involved in D-alanine export
MISYVYESYLGLIGNKSLLRFLNFTFFFPAVLSGPIDRYSRFNKDMDIIHQDQTFPSFLQCSDLLYRIALGAFKTFVISSLIFKYSLSDIDLDGAYLFSVLDIIKAAYAYAFYLYFNFSGYSDMAIGLANLVGIHLPENFNKPFSATSIQDYWNRWHISLSQWIRDFVFIPLAKFFMKNFPNWNSIFLTSFSIFISFVLCGIWHGIELNFLIWGAFHGLGLVIHFIYKNIMNINFNNFYKSIKNNNIYIFASWFLTFHFVVISFLFFSLKFQHLKGIFF